MDAPFIALVFVGFLVMVAIGYVIHSRSEKKAHDQPYAARVLAARRLVHTVLHWRTDASVPPAAVMHSVQHALDQLPKPTAFTEGYSYRFAGEILCVSYGSKMLDHANAVLIPTYRPGQVEYRFFFTDWITDEECILAAYQMEEMRNRVHHAIMQCSPQAAFWEERVSHRKSGDGYGQIGSSYSRA